jgi:hypothetical protein
MEEYRFIFDWARAPKWESNWRLMFLLFVSLVGHIVVFYLFQVSYQPAERWTPRTRGAMLLSSVDPISVQVLRELDDRTFHLHGAGGSEVAAYSLTKMSPRFRPSFFAHEVALRSRPAPEREETLPMLLAPGSIELPEIPLTESFASPTVATHGPGRPEFVEIHAVLEGPASALSLQILPQLRNELASAVGSWNRIRLRLAVEADGSIANLLTESVDEGSVSPRTLEKVRQGVRFQPGADRRWGWMELRR